MEPDTRATPAARRPVIATIGDLILDVIVLPGAPLARDGDTPATITLTAGGQAANVAAWAAALGARSRLICVRGRDPAAILATAQLTGHGVEIVGPKADGRGGVVVSTRELDGARTMASDAGVAGTLNPEDIDPAWVSEADVLHVSGYCLLREPMAAAAITAAGAAKRVSVDLASAHDIALFGVERFLARVEALDPDLVFANLAEHQALPKLRRRRVIKAGAEGATFPDVGHLRAHEVAVRDTTGAGDALAAGYLVGGAELAMAAAAQCVQRVGAMPPADPGREP